MASPFAVFRRNQRVMIAVLGVVTILLFVVGDPLSKLIGGTGARDNPLVVKTNYGNFKRSELDAVVQQRKWVEIFLQRIIAARVEKEFEGRQTMQDRRQLEMTVKYAYNNIHQQLMGREHPPGDAATLETIVLAKRAEEMGMVASDRAVNDLLRLVAGDAFSQLRDIIGQLKHDGHISIGQGYLFDGLRRELLASKYTQMFKLGTYGLPPAERWEYFQQLNLKADVQVLPVRAEEFLKDVPEPSDETLQAYFERYKDQLPEPSSPEPGFKQPLKIAFQYFKANLEKFSERAAEQVTPEEMHEYYDKNKAIQFRTQQLPPAKDGDSPAENGDEAMDDSQSGEPAATGTGDSPAQTSDEPADDKDTTEEKPPAAPTQEPADTAPPAKTTTPAGKKSARLEPGRSATPFRLASAPADKPATPSSDEESSPDQPSEENDTADAPATDGHVGHDHQHDEPNAETKYDPFEKVEETIRKQVAREKAQAAIQTAFDRLDTKLRAYASARAAYRINKEDDPGLKEPEPLDVAALAAEFDITASETDLMSAYEATTQSDLGKSGSIVSDPRIGFRQVGFAEVAYLDPHEYRPETTFDDENNRYLWWETKISPEAVPTFDDVRSMVLHAYKMKEARKLAVAQAEKYVKQVREAKQPLQDVFKGREGLEVTETGPFTRMTLGNTPYDPDSSEPRLSAVHGVEAAGDEFMNSVFSSAPGDVKVALNQPQDIAYVIQVDQFTPQRDSLEREFIVEPFQKYARLSGRDQRNLYLTWINTLEQNAGVDWIVPPRSDTRVEEEE